MCRRFISTMIGLPRRRPPGIHEQLIAIQGIRRNAPWAGATREVDDIATNNAQHGEQHRLRRRQGIHSGYQEIFGKTSLTNGRPREFQQQQRA
jgi:hypothetical protein